MKIKMINCPNSKVYKIERKNGLYKPTKEGLTVDLNSFSTCGIM